MTQNIAVLYGGTSCESDVSLLSVADIERALQSLGHTVVRWRLAQNLRWIDESSDLSKSHSNSFPEFIARLHDQRIDLAFPLMHGIIGEDGRIQAMCEWLQVPYIGTGPAASANCLNKDTCKRILSSHGFNVAKSVTIRKSAISEWIHNSRIFIDSHEVTFPCVVKPIDCGSSIGVGRVVDPDSLAAAIDTANTFAFEGVMIEELVSGVEVEVPVIQGNQLLVGTPSEMVYQGTMYSFDEKYNRPLVRCIPPSSRVSGKTVSALKDAALKAFEVLDLRGIARVDFFVTSEQRVIVNEINTMPFLSRQSCVHEAIKNEHGLCYEEIISLLVQNGLKNSEYWLKLFGCSNDT